MINKLFLFDGGIRKYFKFLEYCKFLDWLYDYVNIKSTLLLDGAYLKYHKKQ